MNESTIKNPFFRGLRQSLVVTLLLLLCGFVFPMVLSGISAVLFPSQANGSLVYADGAAVGAATVGQDFTEPYFMKGRPSAYHYNTYYEDEQGNQYYNDGSAFAGVSSGSNNYAASNPALTERVEARADRAGGGGYRGISGGQPGCEAGGSPRRSDDGLRLRPGPPHLARRRPHPDPRPGGRLRSE